MKETKNSFIPFFHKKDLLKVLILSNSIDPESTFDHEKSYGAFNKFYQLTADKNLKDWPVGKVGQRVGKRNRAYPYKAGVKQECDERLTS